MPSVSEIIDSLFNIGGFEATWYGADEWLTREIRGINTDRDAREGDLAWISLEQAKSHPERLPFFRGSLLICPKEIALQGLPVIACNRPKLAFIHALNAFFSDLALTTWPKPGEYPVSVDAQVAENVTMTAGVVIGSGTVIESDVVIGPNTVIANCTVKRGVRLGSNCTIGLPGFGFEKDETGRYWRFPHLGRVIIEEDVEIGSSTCIDRGSIGNTVIGRGAKIDNLVHIAHNVVVGPNSLVIANSMIGGSATIEENVWVAPSVSVMNQISIGKSAILGMGAVVLKDVEESAVMVGNPAKVLRRKGKP